MSMTGSQDEEEAASEPEKLNKEAAKARVGHKPFSLDLNRCLSPMLGLLGREELVPSILEYEKVMLVVKEHSYARKPDKADLLQLSNLHSKDLNSSTQVEDSSTTSLLNARTDLLQLRESIGCERSEPSVVCHLRQVIGLQVALIREQQEQLHEKDREMNAIKKEKEQLEARLERMDRRLSILQKHSRLKPGENAESPLTSPTNTTAHNSLSTPIRGHLTRRESIIASETGRQSRSSSMEPTGNHSKSRSSSRAVSPADSGTVKRSQKRKLKEAEKDERTPRKKAKHLRELRTDFEYQGLELSVPKQRNGSQSELFPLPNHTGADTPSSDCDTPLSCERVPTVDAQPIITPSWRTHTMTESVSETTAEDCEDLCDEIFNRRHKKPEEEEKRRKRWDIQRARTLREHNNLLRKYNMKSGEKGTDKKEKPLTSFVPHLSEIDTIEVMDTVTVSAFGRPLPVIKPSEFEVPWFDLDVREAKESVRTTRSKSRTHRTSVGGSSDEV